MVKKTYISMLSTCFRHFSTAAAVGLFFATSAFAADDPAPKKKAPTKDDYEVITSSSSKELTVGQKGVFAIQIVPKNGLKVHPQAPLEIKLKSSAGIQTEKNKLGRKQVKDPKATSPELETAMTANAKGDQTIEAKLSFFVCADDWCQRVSESAVVNVAVK